MLQEINTQLLLWINGHHYASLDVIMYWASNRFIWIPLYTILLYLFAKSYQNKIWIVLICITILIVLCDQTANLAKDYFQQLRPCHEPSLANLLYLVNGECGGSFGYVSSHAANSTGLTFFVLMLLNKKHSWLKYVMFTYAALLCYSRIYLAAHYPLDVLRGIALGIIYGFIVIRFYKVAEAKF